MKIAREILEPLILGGQRFPGVWRFLLPPDILQARFPRERRATCNACPKISSDGFRPDYRCCTYHPRIPNYLLGFALESAGSRAAVEELIRSGFVLPEGMERSPRKWHEILRQSVEDGYGKSDHVLCPLLDTGTGQCRIHDQRNAVCSTFFCLYDCGMRGSRLWEAMQNYVSAAESSLAQWALSNAGFDVRAYFQRLDGLSGDVLSVSDERALGWTVDARRHLWGTWFGREVELLRRTAECVSDSRAHLKSIVEQTELIRPARFEAQEYASVPADLASAVDAPSPGAVLLDLLAPVHLSSYAELVREALAEHWHTPAVGSRLVLAPKVRVEEERVRFPAQEGTDEWELPLTRDEASVLASYATPREIRGDEGELVRLAEWLGYGLLVELR